MILLMRNRDAEDTMPQTVPSAGFTPPCDYSTFAENFDLSLLPGGDLPISPSTQFYCDAQQLQQQRPAQPKIHTTFYPSSPESSDIELGPDFQTLLSDDVKEERSGGAYLEVPTKSFGGYRENSFYPSSPEQSLYTASPGSVYSTSPLGDDHYHNLQHQQQQQQHLQQSVKREVCSASTSPLPGFFSPFGIKEEGGCYLLPTSPSSYSSSSPEHHVGGQQVDNTDVLGGLFNSTTSLDKQIKQESTVDFTNILQGFQDTDTLRQLLEKDLKPEPPETETAKPKDHRLLREVLRDTSFQKRFNIRPIDFLFGEGDEDIKMEEPGESHSDLMRTCNEPVIKEAIEKTTKDVVNTCATLGISADPSQWDPASVLSWLRWMCKEYRNHTNPPLPEPIPEQWEISGATLITLPVSEFVRRMPEGGVFLHGHLEIWKAAFSSPEEEVNRNWRPETTSSNASSGDVSDEEEEEPPQPQTEQARPSTSTRSSSNIHLWQFLKELLGSNQHGSCIRWVHREEGIFKIEDSVKVARLWGKRKNRPAMNYDKLSRSIRQYYKKGIMKKPERSQRLVYQFCKPYNF